MNDAGERWRNGICFKLTILLIAFLFFSFAFGLRMCLTEDRATANISASLHGPEGFGVRADPVLSWTGEKGYIGDGVHPESGVLGENFYFRIMFTDEDGGVAPDYVTLYLEGRHPISQEVVYDETLSLDPLNGNDHFDKGVIYYPANLPSLVAGSYKYYYEAGYGSGTGTVRMPSAEGKWMESPVVNTPPTISGGIDKEVGVESTVFRYIATYTDADGNPPDPKHCFLYIDGVAYPMIEDYVSNYLFSLSLEYKEYLVNGPVGDELRDVFFDNGTELSQDAEITTKDENEWAVKERSKEYRIEGSQWELSIYEYARSSDSDRAYYYEHTGLGGGVHEFYFHFRDDFGTDARTNISFKPTIFEGWPDLKISSSDISFVKSTDDPETANLVISAKVHNIGKGFAKNIPVTFWLGDPDKSLNNTLPLNNKSDDPFSERYLFRIDYLAKGQSYTVEWVTDILYYMTQKETYYVAVDMDYTTRDDPYDFRAEAKPRDESIQEIIEYSDYGTNNKASSIFAYGPDIEIREAEVTPKAVIRGREVMFRVMVRNVGKEDVPWDRDIVVRFKLTPPDGNELINVGSYTLHAGMPANSPPFSAHKPYRFSGSADTVVGTWVLTVTAEVSGQFVELEEENNAVLVDVNVIDIYKESVSPSFAPPLFSVLLGLLALLVPVTWLRVHEIRKW